MYRQGNTPLVDKIGGLFYLECDLLPRKTVIVSSWGIWGFVHYLATTTREEMEIAGKRRRSKEKVGEDN